LVRGVGLHRDGLAAAGVVLSGRGGLERGRAAVHGRGDGGAAVRGTGPVAQARLEPGVAGVVHVGRRRLARAHAREGEGEGGDDGSGPDASAASGAAWCAVHWGLRWGVGEGRRGKSGGGGGKRSKERTEWGEGQRRWPP